MVIKYKDYHEINEIEALSPVAAVTEVDRSKCLMQSLFIANVDQAASKIEIVERGMEVNSSYD